MKSAIRDGIFMNRRPKEAGPQMMLFMVSALIASLLKVNRKLVR